MLDELQSLQSWWQNITPETQTAIQEGGLVLAALLVGHFLGAMVSRGLRARNFDAALRLPGSSEPNHGITPTLIAGILVRLTVWAGAAWWLAHKHERVELASTLGLIINRTWALTTVLVAALGLGSMVVRRLMDCLQGVQKASPQSVPSRNGATASRWDIAGAVGAGVYIMVVLLVLLIAADLFDWPLTRSSAQALWQLAQNLLIAGAALLIGCLGASWARELATPDGAASPEKRAGQFTALGIVAATTVLAVAVLLSTAGVLLGLAALGLLGFLVWIARGYLPDVAAGLQLRAYKIREVSFDGAPWQVAEVGFLTSQVGRGGEFYRMQNRRVLDARMHGEPVEAARR